MSENPYKLIDRELVSDMLYGEDKYIGEFAEASIDSFSEFMDHYSKFLLERDMESLRKAGHKIKPVAQILKLDEILNEYDQAKLMLINNDPDEKLKRSVDTVQTICKEVIRDFRLMTKSIE